MLLENLMEEKQLDFNRPLLSVRRFSPAISTAEAENKRKTENGFPRGTPVCKSELRSGPVRNPGTVPFVWEQSPGRPKYASKPQTFDLQHPPAAAPRLPPGWTLNADRHQALDKVFEGTSETRRGILSSLNAPSNETKEESSGDGMEETGVLGSEDDGGANVDAFDTLSQGESFFMNCSISGVSGLDCPDMKQWGTSSTDQQTRDFMMGRFLPAAKAMASETPQYSTRKQPFLQEQPRMKNKLLTMEKGDPFSEGRRLTNVPHCPHSNEEEIEDESGDYDVRKQMHASILTSTNANLRSSSSYVASCPENADEHKKDDVHKQASIHVLHAKGMQNEWKSQSNKLHCRNHENELVGSSLYKRLQGNVPFPYKKNFSKSAVIEETRFLGTPEKSGVNAFSTNSKDGKLFREFLASESSEWESACSSPLSEKTLYTDSVNILKPQISNSCSPDMEGISKHRRDEVTKDRKVEEMTSTYSSFQEDKLVDNENILPKSMESTDFGLQPSSDTSADDVKMVSMNSKHNQDPIDILTLEARPKVDLFGFQITKFRDNVNMKLSNQEEISNGSKSLLPLTPPLPKSPSESWLKRALPAVSSKHTALRSSSPGLNVHPRVQASKVESPDSKWETIVKSAKLQHGHLRNSEKLLSTIPEV